MLFDELHNIVRENVPSHLLGLWTPDGETQLLFADKRVRIPRDGNGEPHFDDTSKHPSFSTLRAIGVTGWNWVDRRSTFITIDVDGLNHADGHDQQTIDDFIARLSLVAEVELGRSKGGEGIHARLYFDPDRLPIARTRKDHISNGKRALAWLAGRVGQDLEAKTDCCGVVAWIYHVDRAEDGFRLLKPSTAFMPEGWESELPPSVTTDTCANDEPPTPVTSRHQAIIDAVVHRGFGEWKDGRLTTHTHNLLALAEDASLKILGGFATTATGKDGPSDRNCFMYPADNGSWRVYRFGKTTEHETWWKSPAGYMTTWFNRGRDTKVNPAVVILSLCQGEEFFHDSTGLVYTTTVINGVKETLPISDARHKAKLRLAYTSRTGRIASSDNISSAIAQLEALGLLERPEYPVAIRVAEHDGSLYIDLANRERQIVKVSADGWQVVNDSQVRFIRPYGMLPLPSPIKGGSLAELRQYINVDDAELPLLLGFVVGCFHPTGPYSLLQIVGEQGSAKSSLLRLIHDFVDPQIATGNTLPRDERDMLVAAQQRWLMSFDNVDSLSRKLSSLLCMLVTGAASANRKLFTDADQSILRAKRPVVLTAIANVVTASDLLDRTLTLVLPPISADRRKSEFAIAQELRRDGVRGRIFGFILDGVSAALAGHANVKRDDMPRLADLFSWATAAEPAWGIPEGSAIESLKRQATEESQHVKDCQFGRELIELAKKGFSGTARELAAAIDYGLTPREIANELRVIAPDLRRNGLAVEFRKSNGAKLIELRAA
jgi:hypothetical protein